MAGVTESFYLRAPIAIQQLLVAAYGIHWYRRRFGVRFRPFVTELRQREAWTAEEFAAFQEQALGRLLQHAGRSSYYRLLLSEAGISESTRPVEALRRLPLLSKETLRTRARELLTTSSPPRGTSVFRSSGTTGTPTEIFYTREFHQLVHAFMEVRLRAWAGVHHRSRRVMFGVRKVCRHDQVRPPFWRFSPAENLAYLSIYHLSDDLMPEYVKFLNRYRPEIVMGYPSSLTTLARFALTRGLALAPARAVMTTSETVTDHAREVLEQAWSCPVFDHYGAVEACVLASQCAQGRYHVSPDFGLVEILREDGEPCAPGEIGEVVCTGLNNTLQPLIRYRIGDVAAWSTDRDCACGRSLPILERIEGRVEDMCFTRTGRAVLRFDTVFKGIAAIKEGQVVQKDLDRFVVNVVPDVAFGDPDRRRILHNMALHVGDVRTDVVVVPSIPRTAGGKFRAVVCEIPRRTAAGSLVP